MNKRIARFLDEIEKTEKKIAEMQLYLKSVKAQLKQEEDAEMIRTIRGMKLNSHDLSELLAGLSNGTITYQLNGESDISAGSFVVKEKNKPEEEN